MNNLKINVIDGIMGSGKSTAIINHVKYITQTTPTQKILIVLLYHKEIARYSSALAKYGKFTSISESIIYKKGALEKALNDNKNIICTQALFLEHNEIFQAHCNDYILIIDEVINSAIQQVQLPTYNIVEKSDNENKVRTTTYTFTSNDIDIMLEQKMLLLSDDNLIYWNNEYDKESIYTLLKDFFSNSTIYLQQNINYNSTNTKYVFIKTIPIELFKTFQDIYILTYLWNAQIMKYYFDMNNSTYRYLEPLEVFTTESLSFEFQIINKDFNFDTAKLFKANAKKLINMPTTEKKQLYSYKNSNNNTINLSYSFYNTQIQEEENHIVLSQLKNNIKNVIENIFKVPAKDRKIMWTIYKEYTDLIVKKQFDKPKCRHLNMDNFVSISSKGTNDFADRNILIYLVDRYINPVLKNFINSKCKKFNIEFDENLYSLSELIQWIWRSQIRNNKPIYLYIASLRMFNLFNDWLNDPI